ALQHRRDAAAGREALPGGPRSQDGTGCGTWAPCIGPGERASGAPSGTRLAGRNRIVAGASAREGHGTAIRLKTVNWSIPHDQSSSSKLVELLRPVAFSSVG